ncbi:MAG: LrgB family protein [Anaerolineae bacterium]|nr:LrgB family protein [Anaerolineae bacterium]
MSLPTQLWASLVASPVLWLTVTLFVHQGARWVCAHVHSPCINPVLISIAVVGTILIITKTPYDLYFDATRFLHFLLGPATVALAVPLYDRVSKLRRLLGPITVALLVGSLTAIVAAVGLGSLLGASEPTLRSLAPKSVTTAIAMGVSEQIRGIPPLTAVLVILTGIIGASLAQPLLDILRIREPSARGFAIGVASHGIGTARAFEMCEETGAFSGLGMGLNGILTALIIPILARWLGWI